MSKKKKVKRRSLVNREATLDTLNSAICEVLVRRYGIKRKSAKGPDKKKGYGAEVQTGPVRAAVRRAVERVFYDWTARPISDALLNGGRTSMMQKVVDGSLIHCEDLFLSTSDIVNDTLLLSNADLLADYVVTTYTYFRKRGHKAFCNYESVDKCRRRAARRR